MRKLQAPSDNAWRTRAACAGTGTEVFFDESEEATERAVAVCQGCSVRALCLDQALAANERHGIWGGFTPEERDRERRYRLRGREPRYSPRSVQAAASSVYREAPVQATGAVRRARALAALGHGAPAIAEAGQGLSRTTVAGLLIDGRYWVRACTHRGLVQAYALLAGQVPEPGSGTNQVRNRARARSWDPPAAWAGVDIDDPAARPRPSHRAARAA